MIHTSITRNCTIFLLPPWQTRLAIYGSQIFDSHKWSSVSVRKVKGKPRNFEPNVCVKHLSNHMHFITNGYKRISKTNSTNPKQRVPLRFTSEFSGHIHQTLDLASLMSCLTNKYKLSNPTGRQGRESGDAITTTLYEITERHPGQRRHDISFKTTEYKKDSPLPWSIRSLPNCINAFEFSC